MLRLYEHSLGLAFVLLFLLAWVGHALGGFAAYAADEVKVRRSINLPAKLLDAIGDRPRRRRVFPES